mmetsp:Transcript_7939/g.26380  ORF Transcript_7939/g.26380 Transcript_7939/m.26380 type:complete len:257 (-) Transcript_7939:408-1178(-)
MSSGPSMTCVNMLWCHASGTTALSAASSGAPSPAPAMARLALVCLQKKCARPVQTLATIASTLAPSASASSAWHPREGAVTLMVHCSATAPAGGLESVTRHCRSVAVLRCSFRYSPCQVPVKGRPPRTGSDKEGPTRAHFTCAGMSSGPSSVWSNHSFQLSGTMESKALAKSRWTSSSAFSFSAKEALVCWRKKLTTPMSAAPAPLGSAGGFRMSVQPRFGARMLRRTVSWTFAHGSTVTRISRSSTDSCLSQSTR